MVKTTVKYICDRCGKEVEFCADGSGEYKKTLEWGRVSVDGNNSTKYNFCPGCFINFRNRLGTFLNDYTEREDEPTEIYYEIKDCISTLSGKNFDAMLNRYNTQSYCDFYMYKVYSDRKQKYLWNPHSKNFEFIGDVND